MTKDLLKQLLESIVKNDDILSLEINGVIHIESAKNIDNERCYKISAESHGVIQTFDLNEAVEMFMDLYTE
jgi:hypothetical protein